MLKEEARDMLEDIISELSVEVVFHPEEAGESMKKLQKEATEEYFLLMSLLNEGYIAKLLTNLSVDEGEIIDQTAIDFAKNQQVDGPKARWAVVSWAKAIGFYMGDTPPSIEVQINQYVSEGSFQEASEYLANLKADDYPKTTEAKINAYRAIIEEVYFKDQKAREELLGKVENIYSETARLAKGVISYLNNDLEKALELLNLALNEKPDRVMGSYLYYYRGLVLHAIGNFNDSKNSLDTSLKLDPDRVTSTEIYYYLGKNNYEESKYKEATYWVERAIKNNPRHPYNGSLYGLLLINEGDYEKAEYYLESSLNNGIKGPQKARTYRELARLKEQQREFSKGLEYINKALAKGENNTDAYLLKGRLLRNSRRNVLAFHSYVIAKELSSEDDSITLAKIYREIALLYLQTNSLKPTIENCNKAIKLNPSDYLSYLYKGEAYLLQSNLNNAYNTLNQAISLNPNDARGHFKRGETVFRLVAYHGTNIKKNPLSNGLESLDIAIEKNYRPADANFFKSQLYLPFGHYDIAIGYLKKTIQLKPKHARAHNDIGYCYLKLEKESEGIEYLNQAINLDPENRLGVKSVAEDTILAVKQNKSFCFLTTAVCEILGKPDDCYELSILRNFRDKVLLKTKKEQALVENYYEIAPEIAGKMYAAPNRQALASHLYNNYLIRIITEIEARNYKLAISLYRNMVNELKDSLPDKK